MASEGFEPISWKRAFMRMVSIKEAPPGKSALPVKETVKKRNINRTLFI